MSIYIIVSMHGKHAELCILGSMLKLLKIRTEVQNDSYLYIDVLCMVTDFGFVCDRESTQLTYRKRCYITPNAEFPFLKKCNKKIEC